MLFDLLADIDPDARKPLYEGTFFFPDFNLLWSTLNAPQAMKHLYEQQRQGNRGLPCWKTFNAMLQSPARHSALRPTSATKLNRMFQERPDIVDVLKQVQRKDAFWPAYTLWVSLVSSKLFCRSEPREHWMRQLETTWQLFCKDMRVTRCRVERTRIYALHPQGKDLGLELTQRRLLDFLANEPDEQALLASAALHQHLIACLCTTLLRFAAWMVVDTFDFSWEQVVRDQNEEKIFLKEFLPRYDPASARFSCPMAAMLAHMAKLTDCPEGKSHSAHLGRLWSEHEYRHAKGRGADSQVDSKQRLLRLWLSRTQPRPDIGQMQSLCAAVIQQVGDIHQYSAEQLEGSAPLLHYGMVFIESSRDVLRQLEEHGFAVEVIEAIFATYAEEYRRARQCLGKPLQAQPSA